MAGESRDSLRINLQTPTSQENAPWQWIRMSNGKRECHILSFHGIPTLWSVTHIEASEEILDGLFRDIIGQVSQECRVRGRFGEAASVDVGLAGGARGRGEDGAVDRRCPVNVIIIAVPRGGDCGERRDVGTGTPGQSQPEPTGAIQSWPGQLQSANHPKSPPRWRQPEARGNGKKPE